MEIPKIERTFTEKEEHQTTQNMLAHIIKYNPISGYYLNDIKKVISEFRPVKPLPADVWSNNYADVVMKQVRKMFKGKTTPEQLQQLNKDIIAQFNTNGK